jgi:hypothetical protein
VRIFVAVMLAGIGIAAGVVIWSQVKSTPSTCGNPYGGSTSFFWTCPSSTPGWAKGVAIVVVFVGVGAGAGIALTRPKQA